MPSIFTILDLGLVILAFTGIIVVHELGHFLAARWAGIRVLAFAVGFGPAIVSFRKGLGWRRGSSVPEFEANASAARGGGPISATEYRLNVLPFGGYVKMLGQDDADPAARSDAPDSYQRCAPWKRMIVISAGVVANIVSAAALFVLVFSVGLRDTPARVGEVLPGSPAAMAVASNAAALGVTVPGLRPGDRIISIDGEAPETFGDVSIAAAMSAPGAAMSVAVEREGVGQPLRFVIEPREDRVSGLRSLGFAPMASTAVMGADTRLSDDVKAGLAARFGEVGVPGVHAGMVLVQVGERRAPGGLSPYVIAAAARESGGEPIVLAFRDGAGNEVTGRVMPRAEFMEQRFEAAPGLEVPVSHVLGLARVMAVADAGENTAGYQAGLRTGDVFARVGDVEFPCTAAGIAEVRRGDRSSIDLAILRRAGEGWERIDLPSVPVRDGRIGFAPGESDEPLIARWPNLAAAPGAGGGSAKATEAPPTAAGLNMPAGARVVRVNGTPVSDFAAVRRALQGAARVLPAGDMVATLEVEVDYSAGPARRVVEWRVPAEERAALLALSWRSPVSAGWFEPEHVLLKASNPGDALSRGLKRTHMVMLNVYLTFARLVQGTVKVEHLQGPVGIAHAGTILAERGYIWLLFFMALVSVNLAVVNFLPLPIVDGGQFLFILYEQVTGRAVSVAVQSIATLAGLAMIGSVFLLVTYNDLARLLWNG